MTRFLKRVLSNSECDGCAFMGQAGTYCLKHAIIFPFGDHAACVQPDSIFLLVPRPPDGTRCRDLDGNIKVVGVDV